jgi:uncharacterized protein YndB with AHSA1/START domain
MKVERRSEHAVSDATCKAATGRTLVEWHGLLDGRGGLPLGRREIGNWLGGELKVDPAACYAAFASAAALDGWFGPGHDVEIADGGYWRNADHNRATVRKATPGKTIRLLWEDEGLTFPTPVEIKFAPGGAKTTVMVTIDRLQTRAEADGYRRGWGEALDRLKATLE